MDFKLVLLAIIWLIQLINFTNGVVVDGHKRKGLSPKKNQSHEKDMIDSFNTKTCGISDPNLVEHEFVNMAREGQFPWIVSFQLKVPINYKLDKNNKEIEEDKNKTKIIDNDKELDKNLEKDLHFCCGSLISNKWILTAAHCFESETMKTYFKNNKLKVVAGSHKVSSKSELNKNLTIDKIFIHKSFNKKNPVGFDIALVELKNGVEFNEKRIKSPLNEQIKPYLNSICLPKINKKYKFNETARIAGWGLSEEKDETSMPSKLLTTDILLTKTDKCAEIYSKELKSDKPKKQYKRFDDFICGSLNNTRDACQSDSGGPLMQFADGKAVVIGIISYGIGCADKVPGIYTRTSAYINWIKEITRHGKESSVAFSLIERNSSEVDEKSEDNHDSTTTTSTTSTSKPNTSNSDTDDTTTTTETPLESTTTTESPQTTTTKIPEEKKDEHKNDEKNSKKFKFFDD